VYVADCDEVGSEHPGSKAACWRAQSLSLLVRVAAAVKQGTKPEALGNFRMLRWDLLAQRPPSRHMLPARGAWGE